MKKVLTEMTSRFGEPTSDDEQMRGCEPPTRGQQWVNRTAVWQGLTLTPEETEDFSAWFSRAVPGPLVRSETDTEPVLRKNDDWGSVIWKLRTTPSLGVTVSYGSPCVPDLDQVRG